MQILRRFIITGLASLPMIAMAHSGHAHQNSFLNGFIHPFTGVDHLMMAIAFGVLMWTAHKNWKIIGIIGLIFAMGIGFFIGSETAISANIAEYGIVFSLLVLAVGLWMKSNNTLPIAAILLASFHGIAHGVELGHSGNAVMLILGMLLAMSFIYLSGLALGAFIQKYVPHGKKVVAVLTAFVAMIGLA